MKFCDQCGEKLEDDVEFCYYCGEPCPTLEEHEKRSVDPSESAEDNASTSNHDDDPASSSSINYLCLILLIGCAILWFTAPFIAINLLTLGDQPTALQLVMDDVTYIGELTETSAFWAAIVSIIGILICLISTLASSYTTTRIVAAITELPMLLAMFEMMVWADDLEELFEALGLGFWGVFILLLVVVFTSKSNGSATIEAT